MSRSRRVPALDRRGRAAPEPDGSGEGPGAWARRVGAAERTAADRLLARAAEEGRFGCSDEYERRTAQVAGARTRGQLEAAVEDLGRLVPGAGRDRVLQILARAHTAEELDFAEFLERSDRAQLPMTYGQANELIADLGETIAVPMEGRPRATRPGWGRVARRIGLPAVGGGLVGGGLVALPVLVALPSQLGGWLPVIGLTGAFSAVGAVAVSAGLRWRFRLAASAGGGWPPPGAALPAPPAADQPGAAEAPGPADQPGSSDQPGARPWERK